MTAPPITSLKTFTYRARFVAPLLLPAWAIVASAFLAGGGFADVFGAIVLGGIGMLLASAPGVAWWMRPSVRASAVVPMRQAFAWWGSLVLWATALASPAFLPGAAVAALTVAAFIVSVLLPGWAFRSARDEQLERMREAFPGAFEPGTPGTAPSPGDAPGNPRTLTLPPEDIGEVTVRPLHDDERRSAGM